MTYPQGPQGGAWLPPPTEAYYQQQQPKRSGIPKVVGILMIIFGSLGLIATMIGFFMDNNLNDPEVRSVLGEDAISQIQAFDTFEKMFGLFIGVLHIVGGIFCVMYKRQAPMLAIGYAVLKILMVVVSIILVYTWLSPVLDKAPKDFKAAFTIGIFIGGMIGIAWPIVVWALMTRPAAKAACDR